MEKVASLSLFFLVDKSSLFPVEAHLSRHIHDPVVSGAVISLLGET